MIIIDSLLHFNCFLSGEVQENLSLFVNQSGANRDDITSRIYCTEFRPVVRFIRAQHGEQRMQQFSHNCDDDLQTSFATNH